MLVHIYIKNIALINEITIDFKEFLNILTGETGAGKSILIGSINFALGERGSRDIIRTGEENALVELLFFVENDEILELIKNQGIEVEEDRYVLITRAINQSGRTVCRINGQTVTTGMLRQVSSKLIDVHGQHEHQSLLDVGKHIELLDSFCKDELAALKKELESKYKEYKNIEKQISSLIGDEKEIERKIDLLQYQLDEITNAKFEIGEEEQLQNQLKKLSNSEKLVRGMEELYGLLYGNDYENHSTSLFLSEALRLLRDLADVDDELMPLYENLENIQLLLDDMVRDIRQYKDQIHHDPYELKAVEERLDLLFDLKRKYGNSIEEILLYKDKIEEELERIVNSEETLKNLKNQYALLEDEIKRLSGKISDIRKEKAKIIEERIESILAELAMKEAKFSVMFSQKDSFNENGWDNVEFLISTNPGEELKPLAKIASGGEMSRIMLALKCVLADIDEIGTLIFDEIDTGISGATAQKVAEKLGYISRKRQVICITHLPQIAAMGDCNYKIEKRIDENKAISSIKALKEDEVIYELARLISGAQITDISLKNAEEMRLLAKHFKAKLN
ncbi:MAG: DNA repair protein RecN [Epulopiscium sp.]|nr:DNA repair protein RecN [Candidatus Epulonipiscium sp.]HOQ16386.1 DNA repair protein RecN [Defluviitaleaceae bacterium]HPT75798.1 DNA repair protein RecN [Defluviitaleaceae bacterium]